MRLRLPEEIAKALYPQGETVCYVTVHITDDCLVAFARESFEEQRARFLMLPDCEQVARRARRLFVDYAHSVRQIQRVIEIPETLVLFAGLNQSSRVTLVGLDSRLEIWSHQSLEAFVDHKVDSERYQLLTHATSLTA
jgi:division/cell wall cluster transcriptional repressor MraZ